MARRKSVEIIARFREMPRRKIYWNNDYIWSNAWRKSIERMVTFGAKARTKSVEIMAIFQECLKKKTTETMVTIETMTWRKR